MARFLFFTETATGHVAPILPICRALVDNGNQVLWITGRRFKSQVEATGADYIPTPEKIDPGDITSGQELFPELRKLHGAAQLKWYYKHVYLDNTPLHVLAINAALEHFHADVLVGDTVMLGVYFKSELSGIPSALISISPLGLYSRDTAPVGLGILPGRGIIYKARNRLLNSLADRLITWDLNAYANKIRRQLGLPKRKSFIKTLYQVPALVLQLTTPAFEYPRSDQPENLHFIGPVLPGCDPAYSPPAWWPELNVDRPVILINQGTVANDPEELIIPAIQGLRDQNIFIVAVPISELPFAENPGNVHGEKFIPFANLLPHVDVMVTNGGYGGVQLALAHGVPLVVSGATEDKMEVGARVEWSRTGINLRQRRPSPARIKEAVMQVLTNPLYRENAQRIQREFILYNASKRATMLLEALAEHHEEFTLAG